MWRPIWMPPGLTSVRTASRGRRQEHYLRRPYSLGVAPSNSEICYATDLFRTYRTLDGGKTWAQVNSVRAGENRWTTRGLDVTTAYGVQFDPFDSKHVFIDYTDIGAFHSFDGGQSWETATNGIPDAWRNTTYWLAFDPNVKGLMWAHSAEYTTCPAEDVAERRLQRASQGRNLSIDGRRAKLDAVELRNG